MFVPAVVMSQLVRDMILVIVSDIYLYLFSIVYYSYSYHIRVIDVRSYIKDPTPLTLAKH